MNSDAQDCLIAFGSNLGESQKVLQVVTDQLTGHLAISDLVVSTPVRTPAVGGTNNQPDYLNACLRFRCSTGINELMDLLKSIEIGLGRQRKERWSSRTVDLDLLLYGQLTINQADGELTVPHPRMSFRRFVLHPANEIAGDMVHPTSALEISDLFRRLDDSENRIGFVTTMENDGVVALALEIRRVCHSFDFDFNHFIQIHLPNDYLDRMKFVVCLENESAEFLSSVRQFHGPMLCLKNCLQSHVVSELAAGIQATLPFTIK